MSHIRTTNNSAIKIRTLSTKCRNVMQPPEINRNKTCSNVQNTYDMRDKLVDGASN
jgi:hypothetical protein